jgi:hypothetical protein
MKRFLMWGSVAAMVASFALTVPAQSDKRVTEIRAKVAAINRSASKYTKTKKDVTGISTEGAEATLFYDGKELKKIAAKIFGETFNGTSEYYFSGGELIFEYDRVNRYDTPIGLERPVKVVRAEQYRSYFDGGKMFKLVIGSRAVAPGSDEFAGHEKGSLANVKSILEPASGN